GRGGVVSPSAYTTRRAIGAAVGQTADRVQRDGHLTEDPDQPQGASLELSVVVPVCNEADNVRPLAREICTALRDRHAFEVLFVDDGSEDGTVRAVLEARAAGLPEIRLIRHEVRCGQSAAVASGVRAAVAPWIATLDGDGQNDPADVPRLLATAREGAARRLGLVIGHRTVRRDRWLRRVSGRVANAVRGWLLGDETPDSGCGIKVFRREAFLDLPRFDHMHRFMPALFRRAGYEVASVPVNHRERTRGRSKYGLHNRLWVGIVDLIGVMWLMRRASPKPTTREEP
ncbi:MAG TPA: glycosyltransferase family 2 protein, partial [Steroidobacteraceae bacterium]|nr:glycosyltransferase family 2 protein [Steroidobacteraceae bacterium]